MHEDFFNERRIAIDYGNCLFDAISDCLNSKTCSQRRYNGSYMNTHVVPHQTRMKSTSDVEQTRKAEGSSGGTDIEIGTFTDLTRLSVQSFELRTLITL